MIFLRRGALALVLALLLVAPHSFLIAPMSVIDAGFYVALALSMSWTTLLVWTVVTELPKLEARWPATPQRPWWLAVFVGVLALGARWIFWPAPKPFFSAASTVHYFVVVNSGLTIALPALVVLTARALGRPIDVARVPLHRWLAGIALVLGFATPVLLPFHIGVEMLFVVAICTLWLRELPMLEAASPKRRWRIRTAALVLGASLVLLDVSWRNSLLATDGFLNRLLARFGDDAFVYLVVLPYEQLFHAAGGLAFAALCATAADGLAYSMRRSRSVRVRMLVLGLACAALGLVLAKVSIPQYMYVFGKVEVFAPLTLLYKVVLIAFTVWTFSTTVSSGLSRPLEQSVRAISEVRRGNLDVALDDSGSDEVAEVARSFNQMVALLREAEFLERINEDLRSRSTQLTLTLQALRTAQADLVRAERMASVATLVKGIAHELNNPINYIAGNMAPLRRYCDFLTRVAVELSDGRARSADELRALTRLADRKDLAFVSEDLPRLTADIAEGARRVQLIITDLQSLTSAAQRGIERVDLHHIVRQTVTLLGPRAMGDVQLETELTPVPPLAARAGQLEQVLVNLTDNALRAVRDQGKVLIYVGQDEGEAVVRVTDDGSGMSAEVKQQAFEPFFTTRSAGEGSGLGLAIVASIVRGHGGTVKLTSEPGRGTEVELRLPIEAHPTVEAELDATVERRRVPSILVGDETGR